MFRSAAAAAVPRPRQKPIKSDFTELKFPSVWQDHAAWALTSTPPDVPLSRPLTPGRKAACGSVASLTGACDWRDDGAKGFRAVWRETFDRLRAGLRMAPGHWRCLDLYFLDKQSHTFNSPWTRSLPQCSIPSRPTASEVVVLHHGCLSHGPARGANSEATRGLFWRA